MLVPLLIVVIGLLALAGLSAMNRADNDKSRDGRGLAEAELLAELERRIGNGGTPANVNKKEQPTKIYPNGGRPGGNQ